MTTIPDGISVRVFKDNERGEFAKYMLKWKKELLFAIENIEVPQNLTAKGLIDFARAKFKSADPDTIITKRNLQ